MGLKEIKFFSETVFFCATSKKNQIRESVMTLKILSSCVEKTKSNIADDILIY